ncbi:MULTISPECIES: hypothetical protein [unclassified Rhodococcus (in: high G+C Gram-positive bacteria)]|uniref:hypothetical protein n=1 Tax=unclassified Rhodococcus (in: high G+C Gram-positive bacteria) TaxID=192944 RepID=UPI0015C590C9|nr:MULTISPECIES: hypothetical protein [unclassified Rhodococcus (in: high G+C Gram-positive bacteria)]
MTTSAAVENASVTRAGVLIRTLDQGLWSLGFFVFNVTAGVSLTVGEFASLSVGAALGFIAVGTSRAWGIYAPIVDAARLGVRPENSIDRSSSWRGTIAFATVVAVAALLWIGRGGEWGYAGAVAALPGAMVICDLPRQVLIIRGRYSRAAWLAAIYAAGAFVCAGTLALGVDSAALLPMWLCTLLIVLTIGIAFCGNATSTIKSESHFSIAWRITAEAVYLGIGSQIATLLLYLIQDDTATAGIRFAYSLVFAPAFVIIQSIQPLIFKQFATLSVQGTRAVLPVSVRWNIAVALGLGACGLVGYTALSTVFSDIGPATALPYVVPVGLAILSAQTFEVALMATRFFVSPVFTHRARLISVLVDVGSQSIAVFIGGAMGLVWTLIVLSALRIAVSVAMLVVLPRRDRTETA